MTGFSKKFKSVTGYLIVLCLLMCYVPVSAGASLYESKAETDVGLLTALNIIPDADNADEIVTRGYLARVIVGLTNMYSAYSGKTTAADINEETMYASYIAAALDGNYMKCAVAGNFLPERNATIEEIARATVILCGYDVTVQNKTDAEYMTAARKLKLISGESGEITKGELWNIALKCLEVYVPEVKYTDDSSEVKMTKKNTLLEDIFGCYKDEGIMTANHITSLSTPNAVYEDYIEINGTRFNCSFASYGDYIGMNCKYVYRKSHEASGQYELVWVKPNGNKTLSVTGINVCGYSKGILTYSDEKGIKRECKFSPAGDIIYNGQSYNSLDDSEWTDGKCDITLVDNDSNGTYDVAFVNKYENYLVQSVFADSFEILAAPDYDWNKSVMLEFERESKCGFLDIYRNNDLIDISSVSADDVISVFKSKSGYTLVAVEGSSTETMLLGVKASNNTIVCNSKEFYCYDTALFEKYLGKEVTVYLDAYANAAFVKELSSGGRKAGYLLGANYNNFDKKAKVQILTSSGEKEVYDVAQRYTHNGEDKRLDKDGIAAFWNTNIDDSENRCVILYTFVKGKGITAIETPVEDTADASTDRLRQTFEKMERLYRPQSKSFLERKNASGAINKIPKNCAISDSCVFFMVSDSSTDVDDISVGTVDAFVLNQWVEFAGFSTSKAKRIDIAIVNGSSNAAESNWKNYGLVTRVSKVYDEKAEDTFWRITFSDGKKLNIDNKYENAVSKVSSLRYGDFIRYNKDLNGYVSDFAKYFDFEKMQSMHDEDETLGAMRTIYGTVTDVTDTLVTIEGANGFEYVENIYFARNKLYRISTEKELCDKLVMESIKQGDRLLLLSNDEVISYGVVYK